MMRIGKSHGRQAERKRERIPEVVNRLYGVASVSSTRRDPMSQPTRHKRRTKQ